MTALVTDVAGNQATVTQTIRLDTTGPTSVVTYPAPGSTVDVGQWIPFIYTSSDVDNVASSSATLDGSPITNCAIIAVDTLLPGSHVIVVTATDGLGNVSTMTVSFEVHATVGGLARAVPLGVLAGKVSVLMLTPLEAKLAAAAHYLALGLVSDAVSGLTSFVALVHAQSGKKIDAAYAALLTAWTPDLIARL